MKIDSVAIAALVMVWLWQRPLTFWQLRVLWRLIADDVRQTLSHLRIV